MKIRKQENVAPINVMPGDTITAYYKEYDASGNLVRHEEVSDTFDKAWTVDRIAIVDLEQPELEQLDMTQAVAGVFGKGKNTRSS